MGREVRRVPANWEHPRDEKGSHIPLYEGPFSARLAGWTEENEMWGKGLRRDFSSKDFKPIEEDIDRNMPFEEWGGEMPEAEDYMPEFSEDQKTHLQMYETCTEGTPISPVMGIPEELARWLVENNASFFGSQTTTYEHWLELSRGKGCGFPIFVCRAEGTPC